MWTLAFGHHEDRTPTHGYASTREDAIAAFAREAGVKPRWPRMAAGEETVDPVTETARWKRSIIPPLRE
jgi:hypothetical protein